MLELHQVGVFVSSSGGCCRLTTDVPETQARTQPGCGRTHGNINGSPASSPDGAAEVGGGGGDAGLDVVVVTLVLVLLLAPHQVGIDVLVNFSLHQIKGEWRELQKQRDMSEQQDYKSTADGFTI